MDITTHPAWRRLQELRKETNGTSLTELFAADPARFERFSARGPGILLDHSKTHLTDATLEALLDLAREAGLPAAIEAMFQGARINTTEDRAALHFALRHPPDRPLNVDGEDIRAVVASARAATARVAREIREGSWEGATGNPIRSVVHIGIGGSVLGPQMVLQALSSFRTAEIDCHFVANVDGEEIAEVLAPLAAEETLIILVSKSFTTLETRLNGETAKRWLLAAGIPEARIGRHLIAVTANTDAALAAGIPGEQVLPMWDWVGGRFSLWSAVGLILDIALGPDVVEEFLRGGEEMDSHFRQAPLERNLPVLMALTGIWYNNLCGAETTAIVPYSHRLGLFPAFLQQLEMESNGKSVTKEGTPVEAATATVVWGSEGSNSQHSFHQLLFQGKRLIPIDFILPLTSATGSAAQHAWLVANCLSQSRALMVGRDLATTIADLCHDGMTAEAARKAAPHRVIEGNHPSCTLLLERLTPRSLGALVALYEHKVFCQGAIWNINSFDQWGVELGKRIANEVHAELTAPGAPSSSLDGSTKGMVALFKRTRNANTRDA